MEKVAISARALAEYIFRSGSIESGFQTAAALVEGTKAHQRIQQTYGAGDQKEVFLYAEIEYEGLLYALEGRCDGLLQIDGGMMIDEIKSTKRELAGIAEDTYPVHWAQAICYAYMYAKEYGQDSMIVQLTYIHTATDMQKQFRRSMSLPELECYILDLICRYAPYASMQAKYRQQRTASIAGLPFPFPSYRAGQRRLAGAAYKSIQEKRSLFAKAPTGIGKTISTLFPAVKAIGEGHLQRIFYLTARTTTRTAAEEAVQLLQRNGLQARSVTITAKDQACLKEETICKQEHCEFADGYYDRINGAILDILSGEIMLTRPVIEQYARKHRVCPFEFSLDLAYASDLVICDYNYIFDPRVSLKRLLEEQKRQTALLVDEAHNLPERAREMFSAVLQKSDFLQLKRMFKGVNPELHAASGKVNDACIAIRKQPVHIWKEVPQELVEAVEAFVACAEEELQRTQPAELLDAYFAARDFVQTAGLFDKRYVAYAECERSEVKVKLFCLDPSHLLRKAGKGYRSKIYFSATLTPLSYYEDMLGAVPEDFVVSIPSPFRSEQLQVEILPLSTRYQDREQTKGMIARSLAAFVGKGNYLIFFPSYQYLRDVYEEFLALQPDTRTLVQQSSMDTGQREEFLAAFQENPEEPLVGFAVLGGIFSEGIDLKGDRLNGVAVIGVGLPQLGMERNIIRDYFQETGRNGYDYAYVFPGMNKVLQAGGRLIRSETDTGRILLIDDRFLQQKYQQLLPEEWRHFSLLRQS
ncbi:helicase C-terminal domain-containing protein [Ectobacillus ponti]|uniref:ATP-dependent DNA helicase n=1 Tax=Ectobacillus ponti TaxID=2961894 RepID=A0AA41X841_9BACI|nr:helicase C-terminal domain-containing protein [Ectobacillus ponti]MCP8968085.1 ATP-dependent DNA helicase [Ectobacillus ponti]